jgi:hypothetical protein
MKRMLFLVLLFVSILCFSQDSPVNQKQPPVLICTDHWWYPTIWNRTGQVCYPKDQDLKKDRTSTSIKKFCATNPADGTILYGSGLKVSCHDWLEANPPKERKKK